MRSTSLRSKPSFARPSRSIDLVRSAESSARYDRIRKAPMLKLRQSDLPFRGSSHDLVGADHGNVNVSAFLFRGLPGAGPGPHRHPYDEVQFIQEGRGTWVVNGQEFEAAAGDILVIKAGEVHSFKNTGETPLVQLDMHISPRFVQENLCLPSVPG